MKIDVCKICESSQLDVFAHTARCENCGTLLFYPYPDDDLSLFASGGKVWSKESAFDWYSKSSFHNHDNFTNMIRFAMNDGFKGRELDILDYGGGGGQFALVLKSHFPKATIYITDISSEALLDEWSLFSKQIAFSAFNDSDQQFDFIFLNDVFEHVSDPTELLRRLSTKLRVGGQIFIDTPKSFWIYSLVKLLSNLLYEKVLRGTVSAAHLQIWTRKSFEFVVHQSQLEIDKYEERSEYTMPANFYLDNMGISNSVLRLVGRLFYANAKWLARNKIVSVLSDHRSLSGAKRLPS